METGRLRRGSGETQEGQVEVQVTSKTGDNAVKRIKAQC